MTSLVLTSPETGLPRTPSGTLSRVWIGVPNPSEGPPPQETSQDCHPKYLNFPIPHSFGGTFSPVPPGGKGTGWGSEGPGSFVRCLHPTSAPYLSSGLSPDVSGGRTDKTTEGSVEDLVPGQNICIAQSGLYTPNRDRTGWVE